MRGSRRGEIIDECLSVGVVSLPDRFGKSPFLEELYSLLFYYWNFLIVHILVHCLGSLPQGSFVRVPQSLQPLLIPGSWVSGGCPC